MYLQLNACKSNERLGKFDNYLVMKIADEVGVMSWSLHPGIVFIFCGFLFY